MARMGVSFLELRLGQFGDGRFPAGADLVGSCVAGDEDEARAMIGARPGVEFYGRMQHMVDALDDDRARASGNVQNALAAQEILAEAEPDAAQPSLECRPGEWRRGD